MTSLLECRAAGKTGEKILQLDLDPTSFKSHRQYTQKCRKSCWLSVDGLISDVGLRLLDVEAPE